MKEQQFGFEVEHHGIVVRGIVRIALEFVTDDDIAGGTPVLSGQELGPTDRMADVEAMSPIAATATARRPTEFELKATIMEVFEEMGAVRDPEDVLDRAAIKAPAARRRDLRGALQLLYGDGKLRLTNGFRLEPV